MGVIRRSLSAGCVSVLLCSPSQAELSEHCALVASAEQKLTQAGIRLNADVLHLPISGSLHHSRGAIDRRPQKEAFLLAASAPRPTMIAAGSRLGAVASGGRQQQQQPSLAGAAPDVAPRPPSKGAEGETVAVQCNAPAAQPPPSLFAGTFPSIPESDDDSHDGAHAGHRCRCGRPNCDSDGEGSGTSEERSASPGQSRDQLLRRRESPDAGGHPVPSIARHDSTFRRTVVAGASTSDADAADKPTSLSPCASFTSEVSDMSELVEAEQLALSRIENHAALELFLRLNHARQTVDYVKRQMASYAQLDKGQMRVWDALELLNELREYESALVGEEEHPPMTFKEHAFQTAEACRAAFPEHDWMHLVGLLHSLGKLLAHKRFGALPQWSVCGESFPIGCRFSSKVVAPHFFSVNPDRRRRMYHCGTGMYRRNCGLKSVYMSWSGAEYLHLVLVLNRCSLPPPALFVLRHQRFRSLLRGAYKDLLNEDDVRHLPWLQRFAALAEFKRRAPAEGAPQRSEAELVAYYDALIAKYIPNGELFW